MSDWIGEFRRTVESASQQLLAISDQQAATTRCAGTWSPKQIIGHLIDSAANNHQRFVRAQFTDELVCPTYDQGAWVESQHYNDEPWSQLVQLWRHYNLHLAHLMSVLPEAIKLKPRKKHNLDRVAWKPVSAGDPVDLKYFMRDYVGHLEHHLNQIFASGEANA